MRKLLVLLLGCVLPDVATCAVCMAASHAVRLGLGGGGGLSH